MHTITIQIIGDNQTVELSCDNNKIHQILHLLESHPRIKAYKISTGEGILDLNNLKYFYAGYASPSGKAVEQFKWQS